MKSIFWAAMAAATLTAASAKAEKASFSYMPADASTIYTGDYVAQTYNVAIHLIQPEFTGKIITGLRVPVPGGVSSEGLSGWLSSELRLSDVNGQKVNDPDIMWANARMEKDGKTNMLVAEFAEPFMIPDGGVYAGYTFTVDESGLDADTEMPVAGCRGIDTEGFYMFASLMGVKWKSLSEARNFISALQVELEGEFPPYSVGLSMGDRDKFAAMEPFDLPVKLTNYTIGDIASISYTYTCGENSGANTIDFNPPLTVGFGHSASCELPIDLTLPIGDYPVSIRINGMNGGDNINSCSEIQPDIHILSMIPVNRPLMEEFTGLWCGWCPRGFAAMQMFEESFGDLFVCASYHSNDVLAVYQDGEFPFTVTGYPAAYMNRDQTMLDPFYGDDYSDLYKFGMYDYWVKLQKKYTPWAVEATARWNGDNIEIESKTLNVEGAQGMYMMMYLVLADGLTGEGDAWEQQNKFSGDPGWGAYPSLEAFSKAGPTVSGLVYNDVVVGRSSVMGEFGSLPMMIEKDVEYPYSHTIEAGNIVNLEGQPVIQNKDKVYVVACVMDASTMTVANCVKCHVEDSEGVSVSHDDLSEAEVTYYDINGNIVDATARGMLIRHAVYPDGKVTTTKIVR